MEFQRIPNRFVTTGLSLNAPKDITKQGGFPKLTNMRSYEEGTLNVRPGTAVVTTLDGPVHSLFRLNDPTPFNGGRPAIRVFGSGGNLYACPVTGPYPPALHETGFSGNPLTGVPITPEGSAQPYLYIVDSAKMGKMRVQGDFFEIGITAPLNAPTSVLQPLGLNIIEQFTPPGIGWSLVGGSQVGDLAFIYRVNAHILEILYDDGAPGNASIVPNRMDDITAGTLLNVNSVENVAVTQTTIAVANTTIAAILYDSGSTGLCTIQPAASLGTGQVTAPSINDVRQRYGLPYAVPRGTQAAPVGGPATPGVASNLTISQVDFPVNSLVRLGGTELVRIISVAIGQDGVQSFRCRTTSTHVVNEAIQGVASFRAWLNGTYVPAQTLIDWGLSISVFPLAPNPPVENAIPQATAGVRSGGLWGPRNLALINGRATLPGDDIHLSIRATNFVALQTVRLYFSMEESALSAPSSADFTENYYFFEWRQSDIAAAIQATNAQTVDTIMAARQTVLENQQLSQQYGESGFWPTVVKITGPSVNSRGGRITTGEAWDILKRGNKPPADDALSQALALGNNQWIELTCKVGDLIRIGTDSAASLARITAAEILVNVTNDNDQIFFDALWLSGGYEPSLTTGDPYVWSYRYRSTITGARSNPSPNIRGGVIPHRQAVRVAAVSSPDPQVDTIDWFRLGGALPTWTYDGSTRNDNPSFLATYSDEAILGGESLDFDLIQPWPSTGPDVEGTVNVAGTAVRRVTGDAFNPFWVPGTQILIAGQPYTIYAQPADGNFLELVENAGAQFNVPYTIGSPTILGSKQATLSDDFMGFHFSVGDPANPGRLRWTRGNEPDATTLAGYLDITSSAEPLMNVFLWDGVPFVWSSDNLWRIEPEFNKPNMFRAYVTPCGRGLWSTWAFCQTPQGVVFLAKDGLYITNGGSPGISISNEDLYRLFPHDGVDGSEINGYKPPDMSQFAGLRLSYIDGYVYFDYAVAG